MMHLTQCLWPWTGAAVTTCGAIYRSQFWKGVLPPIVADLTFQSQSLNPGMIFLPLAVPTMKFSSIFAPKFAVFFLARWA